MNKEPLIATVVVTYNRCELLVRCLKAIEEQSLQPSVVFIIDNASTDNTRNLIESFAHTVPYEYIRLPDNIGGAGGFYTGLKIAHEKKQYDAFWVMDDDGLPDKDCLKHLYANIKHDFVGPLVLDIDNPASVAFPYLKEKSVEDIISKYGSNGIIDNYANPFNGILFSDSFLNIVGYPKKEMFIWGDEKEYMRRAISKGFTPKTIVCARHYHPKDRLVLYRNFLGGKTIVYVESELRLYCKYRNTAYSLKKYTYFVCSLFYFISYTYYYIINRKMDLKGLSLFMKAFRDGRNSDFSHHKEYL